MNHGSVQAVFVFTSVALSALMLGGCGEGVESPASFGQQAQANRAYGPCDNAYYPVAFWTLDNLNGNMLVDNTPAQNHGTAINGPVFAPGFRFYEGLSFDGVNDYGLIPNGPALNFGTGDFSLSFCVRTTSSSGMQVLVDKRTENSGLLQGYVAYLDSGRAAFQMASAGVGANFNSGAFVADGQWHRIAITVDRDQPTGGRIYVDGVQRSTFNPTAYQGSLTNPVSLRLGMRSDNQSWPGYYSGILDEVRLFDRALVPSEI